MIKTVVRLVLLAALVAFGYWIWITFFPTPRKAIERRLVKLAEQASFSGHEGNIGHAVAIEKMGVYFTEDVHVTVNVPGLEEHTFDRRDELMQAAMAARSTINGLKVKFVDLNIDLAPDGQSATAVLTLEAQVAGQSDLIVQELKFTLKKISHSWLISQIDTVEPLKQSP